MTFLNKIIAVFMSVIAFLTGAFTPASKAQVKLETVAGATSLAGDAGDSVTFTSDSQANCLVLKERGNSIKQFCLEKKVAGEYVVLTKGDTVGKYRFCAFDSVESGEFRLTVSESVGGFRLTGISLGFARSEKRDFKVVSYYVANNGNGTFDEGNVRATTDMIFFGIANFDSNGTVTMQKEDKIAEYMANARAINPDIRIHLNLLGPAGSSSDWETAQEEARVKCENAMVNHREEFIANIVAELDRYGFDGIYFDWEYPVSNEARVMFSSFLVALDKAIGSRELGAAMAEWCCTLTPSAIDVLDNVEIMAYDSFDEFGYHASFTSSYYAVCQFLKNGYSKEQLHLGLAFYARPVDRSAYWPGYSEYANTLGKYGNLCKADCGGEQRDCYFNGPQLIRDKTAYAYNCGLGGVMTWHLACDVSYQNELSLYHSIETAIA